MRNSAIILTNIPPLPFCRPGQRFIYNHILYICHQFGPNFRGFRPFACTVKNEASSELVLKNTTHDDKNFRYKCSPGKNNSLSYQAVNCFFNNIFIQPGNFHRNEKTEHSCHQDGDGFLKLVEKTVLHNYCLPIDKTPYLYINDKCPECLLEHITLTLDSEVK
uniref:Abnormal cell migration protein 18-like fibronectin type I domain-containing protein n=1 Tax=Ditylenchus dipsaci TaxID=166011 RepID=A0A915CWL8_9BILA